MTATRAGAEGPGEGRRRGAAAGLSSSRAAAERRRRADEQAATLEGVPCEPVSLPAKRTIEHYAQFAEYRRTGDRRIRNELIERYQGLAHFVVKRYTRRGVPMEDLRQVALLAVLQAVERFDPEMGIEFSTFASRTIDGELKRYFRDRSWSIRPPRRAQELHLEVRQAEERLLQSLGRSPTVAELARAVDAPEELVLAALEVAVAHQTASLDEVSGRDDDTSTRGDRVLGGDELRFARVEASVAVEDLLAELPERERTILYLRFYCDMTQPEIAEALGVSQSYLSRLLRRTLVRLRASASATA